MRASPLGVLAHRLSPREAAALAARDSALTHPHPVCGDSVAAFVVAVAHAIDAGDGAEAALRGGGAVGEGGAGGLGRAQGPGSGRAQPRPECDGSSQGGC
jgi:ADP-ribosylglycohydrolase